MLKSRKRSEASEGRLDPYNHYPPWREYITGIVDTLPIFVSEPAHFPAAKLLYQPKYKRHCYKMQLGITFAGNIILWTGPHFGSTADITIWRDTWAHHPFRSWEAWLADLGYCGAIGLITKYKRQRRRRRTDPRIPFTRRQERYAAHVRHTSAPNPPPLSAAPKPSETHYSGSTPCMSTHATGWRTSPVR